MTEILILLTLWLIACAVCFAVGFFIAWKYKNVIKPKKALEPISEIKVKEAEKIARELENFYSYDGSVQNDFNTQV